jgi:hypothetical protein
MLVRVLYHDNCFDGASSAALFSEFYSRCVDKSARFEYHGMSHGPGDVFRGAFREGIPGQPGQAAEAAQTAEVAHACVDFRYSTDSRLTYWFDHHQSAFMSDSDAAYFHEKHNPRHFYDPKARSCAKFLADSCEKTFGFDTAPFRELIDWADLIDSASFRDPAQAVEWQEPALQLMTWVEANREISLKRRFIADLRSRSLAEIAAADYVQRALEPLRKQNERLIELMRTRAQIDGGVVTFDLSDEQLPSVNKFVPYYLHPDAHYVVGVMLMPGRAKISVGSNPWQASRRTANIASICGRYGGGGHPVVGAISLPASDIDRTRDIARDIASELREAAAREA